MSRELWFATKASGVNSDLTRHDEMKANIEAYIAESDNPVVIKSYKKLLSSLDVSKANVTDRIGR